MDEFLFGYYAYDALFAAEIAASEPPPDPYGFDPGAVFAGGYDPYAVVAGGYWEPAYEYAPAAVPVFDPSSKS